MVVNLGIVLKGAHVCGGLEQASRVLMSLLVATSFSVTARAAESMNHWVLPQLAITEADRPQQPAVFGTVPLSVHVRPTSTRWSRVMMAPLDQPALARLAMDARDLPPHEQAAFVQIAVNHAVKYSTPSHDCSDDGYWAPASETLVRGMGDCIDIAIAKMEVLRFLGVSAKDLYLTTGYLKTSNESEKGQESAALLVRIGESFWLLPEQSEHIVEASSTSTSNSDFNPVVTYGVGMTWVHGHIVRTTSVSNSSQR